MTRYRNQNYLNEINDDELDEENVLQEAPDLPAKDPEEDSWKKRYGDLRRKHQADATTLESKVRELEKRLNDATKNEVALPKTEAQVSAWMKEFPDVAGVIKSMILIEQGKTREEIKRLDEENAKDKHDRELEAALNQLLKSHPDFLEIRGTEEFIDWAETQPKWVHKALYDESEIDVLGAVRAIDLFKLDQSKTKKPATPAPVRDTRREDATAVRSPRSVPEINSTSEWTESRVEALSRRDYARYEDEIDEAIRTGKFVYDLSAGAR